MNRQVLTLTVLGVMSLATLTGCSSGSKKTTVDNNKQETVAQVVQETQAKERVTKNNGVKLAKLGLEEGIYTVECTVLEGAAADYVTPLCNMKIERKNAYIILEIKDEKYNTVVLNRKKYERLFKVDEGPIMYEIPVHSFDKEMELKLINSDNKEDEGLKIKVKFDSNTIKLVKEASDKMEIVDPNYGKKEKEK